MCAPLVDQQFGYAAPLLHLAGISIEFSGAITTQFCFNCMPVVLFPLLCFVQATRSALPHGLHAVTHF